MHTSVSGQRAHFPARPRAPNASAHCMRHTERHRGWGSHPKCPLDRSDSRKPKPAESLNNPALAHPITQPRAAAQCPQPALPALVISSSYTLVGPPRTSLLIVARFCGRLVLLRSPRTSAIVLVLLRPSHTSAIVSYFCGRRVFLRPSRTSATALYFCDLFRISAITSRFCDRRVLLWPLRTSATAAYFCDRLVLFCDCRVLLRPSCTSAIASYSCDRLALLRLASRKAESATRNFSVARMIVCRAPGSSGCSDGRPGRLDRPDDRSSGSSGSPG